MQRRIGPVVLVLGVLVFASCASLGRGPAQQESEVRRASESFASNLRWGRLDAAAQSVHPGQRLDFLQVVRDPASPVRFTDYAVVGVALGEKEGEASALVEFTLHRLPSISELRFSDRQSWRYDERAGTWYLVPELAAYRDAGRGVASPAR